MQKRNHIKVPIAGSTVLLPVLAAVLFFLTAALKEKDDDNGCDTSLLLLKQTLSDSVGFFIKVHAAENLIARGCTTGIREQFEQLQAAAGNEIGAVRVLARLHKPDPVAYNTCINLLMDRFRNGPVQIRLVALESLGKLGYYNASAAVRAYADTGTAGFKAMARWVLANGGTPAAEDRLSALLLSHEPADYRYAAYALRFRSAVNPRTLQRLRSCLSSLKGEEAARVYVASCLYVHGRGAEKQQAKKVLLTYRNGDVAQRYEMAEALGIAGAYSDKPVLQTLLADSNADVRVAAANALSKIMRCAC